MSTPSSQPRILIATPEAVFVPAALLNRRHCQRNIQGGWATFLSGVVDDLCERGVDVHVAQPDYRRIFAGLAGNKRQLAESRLPADRLHLAEDRIFFYSNPGDANSDWENTNLALIFQREISHQILPRVQPDLIHCHDWMTGLIPALAKQRGIPCLFSASKVRSAGSLLARVEDRGIDAAAIWQYLYYDRYPGTYQETRDSNPLDFLLSGILSARHVNTLNFSFVATASEGRRDVFLGRLIHLLQQRRQTGSVSELPDACIRAKDLRRHCIPASYGNQDAIDQNAFRPTGGLRAGQDSPLLTQQQSTQWILKLYEKILDRPLVAPTAIVAGNIKEMHRHKAIKAQRLQKRIVQEGKPYAAFARRGTTPVAAA